MGLKWFRTDVTPPRRNARNASSILANSTRVKKGTPERGDTGPELAYSGFPERLHSRSDGEPVGFMRSATGNNLTGSEGNDNEGSTAEGGRVPGSR